MLCGSLPFQLDGVYGIETTTVNNSFRMSVSSYWACSKESASLNWPRGKPQNRQQQAGRGWPI